MYWKTIGLRPDSPNSASGDLRSFGRQAAQADADRRLRRQADLDIGRAVAAEDGAEPAQEVVAQALGVALAAEQRVHLVGAPVEADRLGLVEEELQERRIADDEVAIAGAELAHRAEDLVDVGPVALTRPFASSAIAVVRPVAQAPMLNALRTTSGSSPNV